MAASDGTLPTFWSSGPINHASCTTPLLPGRRPSRRGPGRARSRSAKTLVVIEVLRFLQHLTAAAGLRRRDLVFVVQADPGHGPRQGVFVAAFQHHVEIARADDRARVRSMRSSVSRR